MIWREAGMKGQGIGSGRLESTRQINSRQYFCEPITHLFPTAESCRDAI
jgi:hypothetical protein